MSEFRNDGGKKQKTDDQADAKGKEQLDHATKPKNKIKRAYNYIKYSFEKKIIKKDTSKVESHLNQKSNKEKESLDQHLSEEKSRISLLDEAIYQQKEQYITAFEFFGDKTADDVKYKYRFNSRAKEINAKYKEAHSKIDPYFSGENKNIENNDVEIQLLKNCLKDIKKLKKDIKSYLENPQLYKVFDAFHSLCEESKTVMDAINLHLEKFKDNQPVFEKMKNNIMSGINEVGRTFKQTQEHINNPLIPVDLKQESIQNAKKHLELFKREALLPLNVGDRENNSANGDQKENDVVKRKKSFRYNSKDSGFAET